MLFQNLNISIRYIQIVSKLNREEAHDTYTNLLVGRGFFQNAERFTIIGWYSEGKVLVAVYEVTDPAPVIDIFDKFKAEYNPNGSRNLRQDVGDMTVGAVVGAAAGSIVGSLMGGPLGAAAGAAAGAVVGGGSGAVVGKSAEHRK